MTADLSLNLTANQIVARIQHRDGATVYRFTGLVTGVWQSRQTDYTLTATQQPNEDQQAYMRRCAHLIFDDLCEQAIADDMAHPCPVCGGTLTHQPTRTTKQPKGHGPSVPCPLDTRKQDPK